MCLPLIAQFVWHNISAPPGDRGVDLSRKKRRSVGKHWPEHHPNIRMLQVGSVEKFESESCATLVQLNLNRNLIKLSDLNFICNKNN